MTTTGIREEQEERERGSLSPFACLSAESSGRARSEEPCAVRTAFQRDRDRIVHCKAFRRLKHKTQVFIDPEEDHYRTRLTHTLEVSQVARTIARALRLNEDLTEAIALGHDLGHAPFGHTGEWAIDEVYREYVPGARFRHYEQSLRVVDFLEKDGRGLNLTAEVREGILNHSKGSGDLRFEDAAVRVTLEGGVVRISDRIAYVNHDIDDALRAGVISPGDLPSECVSVLGATHSARIARAVINVVEHSRDRDALAMSPEVIEAMNRLKDFLFKRVYSGGGPGPQSEALRRAGCLVKELFRFYMRSPDSLPDGWLLPGAPTAERARAVCDFVAGMTDRYAERICAELSGQEIL